MDSTPTQSPPTQLTPDAGIQRLRACVGCKAEIEKNVTCEPCWRALPKRMRLEYIAARKNVAEQRSNDLERRSRKQQAFVDVVGRIVVELKGVSR